MSFVMLLPPSLGQLRAEARADVLAEWLRKRFGDDVRVEVADSYDDLEASILRAQVDFAWAPPAICARVAPHVPAVFKAVRDGHATYCSAIVARRDGPKSIAELRGKRPAWIDARSVGGYLLAVAHLRQAGIDPERDLAPSRFYGAYGDALRAVVSRQADFAATFSATAEEAQTRLRLHELIGSHADHLAILAYTEHAPSDGLVVTTRLGVKRAAIVERLRPLVDGSQGHTFILSLLEADRLVLADPGDYAPLRS